VTNALRCRPRLALAFATDTGQRGRDNGEGAGREVEDQASVEWRKSSFSTTNGCVEVAVVGDRIAVRDSKQQGRGPVLEFTATEWAAFLGGVRGGEFDLSDGR
jgi:Domain of unknown function (DUF397)